MFLQNAPSGSVFLPLRLSVRQFQMPLERLSFVKTLTKFGIVYSSDPLLPLPPLPPKFALADTPSVFWTINLCRPWITCANFFLNQGSFPHALSLKRSRWSPICFALLTKLITWLQKKLKRSPDRLENFRANVLKRVGNKERGNHTSQTLI